MGKSNVYIYFFLDLLTCLLSKFGKIFFFHLILSENVKMMYEH